MSAGGRDAVIVSLLALRGMGVSAVLAALPSLIMQEHRRFSLAVYITDCLQAIAENTASHGGKIMQKRWKDVVDPAPEETRSGEEVAMDIIQRAGLKVVTE